MANVNDIKKDLKEDTLKLKNDTIDILQTIINLQDNHIKNDEIKNRRAFRLSIVIIIAFLLNNIVWIYAYNNREIVTETITTTQESNGDSNIVNGNNYQDNAVHNQSKEDKKDQKNKVIGGVTE